MQSPQQPSQQSSHPLPPEVSGEVGETVSDLPQQANQPTNSGQPASPDDGKISADPLRRFEDALTPRRDEKPVIWPRFLPIGLLLGVFALWACFGKIPVRASGRAVVLVPRSSVSIQPRIGGRVMALNIRPGDQVKKGQLLATMDSPEQTLTLQQKRDRLADLQSQDRQIASVQKNRTALNQSTTDQKNLANLRQIASLQVQLASNQSQRAAYIDHLKYLSRFSKSTDQRLDTFNYLAKEGIVPRINYQSYFLEANQQTVNHAINEVRVQLERLDGLDETLRAQILVLQAGNKALLTENQSVALGDTVSDVTRYNLIAEQKREIAALNTLMRSTNEVVSPADGTIEEVSVNAGEVVLPGVNIGKMTVSNPNAKANVVALFQVGDAKQLAPGATVEVIPDLYKRERYGGIVAKVVEIGEKPVTVAELANLVGSRELALKLALGRDESDPEKPAALNASLIKVELELQPNSSNPSGYQWTEKAGPPQKITNGTTADVHAVLEEQPLIAYLAPTFRWITGVYGE
ncbi:MAG: NHLP bacteriocin system secretion protein [Scytolyngbya sp. HA4215-MV1]|jgi:NHLM bacteriocin system secretion protein|nr:NHLP bacteriocin system secretion protein [Scytolyngbya sp. HA4215-MV1]